MFSPCCSWQAGLPRGGKPISKEGHHVSTRKPLYPPPRLPKLARSVQPKKLWRTLADEDRDQILNALSRVVAAHLAKALLQREVTHERR
jgi:hypothetical protein